MTLENWPEAQRMYLIYTTFFDTSLEKNVFSLWREADESEDSCLKIIGLFYVTS